MSDEQDILQLLTPKAVLQTMTAEAQESVPLSVLDHGLVRISHFPFNVGRESRGDQRGGQNNNMRSERVKRSTGDSSNDLYLTDAGRPMNISREHFRIEKTSNGYQLVDRYSACGTSVNNQHIGGRDAGGTIALKGGDTIAVGVEGAPYIFKFITL